MLAKATPFFCGPHVLACKHIIPISWKGHTIIHLMLMMIIQCAIYKGSKRFKMLQQLKLMVPSPWCAISSKFQLRFLSHIIFEPQWTTVDTKIKYCIVRNFTQENVNFCGVVTRWHSFRNESKSTPSLQSLPYVSTAGGLYKLLMSIHAINESVDGILHISFSTCFPSELVTILSKC